MHLIPITDSMDQQIPRYSAAKEVLHVLNNEPKQNYIFLMNDTSKTLMPVVVDFRNTSYALCSIQVFMQLRETGKLKRVNVAMPFTAVHYHYYLAIQDRGDTPKIVEPVTAGSACPKTLKTA